MFLFYPFKNNSFSLLCLTWDHKLEQRFIKLFWYFNWLFIIRLDRIWFKLLTANMIDKLVKLQKITIYDHIFAPKFLDIKYFLDIIYIFWSSRLLYRFGLKTSSCSSSSIGSWSSFSEDYWKSVSINWMSWKLSNFVVMKLERFFV